jgi:hypothetical protein
MLRLVVIYNYQSFSKINFLVINLCLVSNNHVRILMTKIIVKLIKLISLNYR